MAASRYLCGVCTLRHISKPSIVWCTECDEGLCTECQEHHNLSKASRNHDTILVTEYQKLPPDVLSISQYCDKHKEKYQIYCKKHECPCCSNCIVESHNECRDIVTLAGVIRNVKTSNAFYEIEQNLAEVLENIKKIRENRQDNLKTLSKERAIIEREIEQTRETICNHLDNMKNDIIKELYEVEKQENKEICQLIKMLEEKENNTVESLRKIESIRQHASDLQAFLAMKQLEKDVFLKDEFLQSRSDKDIVKQYSLIYKPNDTLKTFASDVKAFGQVLIETKLRVVALTRNKGRQAQITVPNVESKSIEEINLQLHKQLNLTGRYVFGCCVLPNGKTAFTNYNNCVIILNKDGSFDSNVKIPYFVYDVEYINQDNTLVVTSPCSHITIIDMKDKQVTKKIPLNSVAHGIAGTNDGLIYSGREKGIQMISLHDESVQNIVKDEMPHFCYVATFDNNIYHTDSNKNTVTCYDLKGNKQWAFMNKSVLKYPTGISVDNNGNVFVVGRTSNNVVVISADGKRHRVLLSSIDGLDNPWSLHYDRSTNRLLVANHNVKAFVYSVG
ncbi:uncharacterized protein LOC127704703 [Mytilus californianus]|uniref:uncharacterized protein LOC127704703 n=1 Tax=Mytilus californianus TaxID=6549 RepID=UPI0022452A3C|nr:uncharacterized protein LOC127704703 [Mytilus californianus]